MWRGVAPSYAAMNRALLCTVAALGACAARQDPATLQRVSELEAKLAALEARPARDDSKLDRPAEPAWRERRARRRPPAPSQMPDAMRAELESFRGRLMELERSTSDLWTAFEHQVYGDLRAPDPRFQPAPGTPRPQLKPDIVYSVPIANNPMRGDPSAKVTWVIAMEVTEPYTRKLLDTVKTIAPDYGTDLRIVFKHHVVHDFGVTSALALCAANQQGKFEEALAAVLELPLGERSAFRMQRLLARMLSFLDRRQAEADVIGACKKLVRDDHLFAQRMNQGGTPYSFINGRHISGAQSAETFKKLIDEELARADAALGTRPAKGYYDSIVKRGQKQP
jgi:protein-disulfide isomerase